MRKQYLKLHSSRCRQDFFGRDNKMAEPLTPISRSENLTEPEQIEVASCRKMPILAILAKAIDGAKIQPGDSDETITSKFGSLAVQLPMGKIAVRVDNFLFLGRPLDFVTARAWYGINKTV